MAATSVPIPSACDPPARVRALPHALVALRGAALALLALDQARRYLIADVIDSIGVPLFATNVLSQASVPVLVFVEGMAAGVRYPAARSAGSMSRDLVARGAFLILLDLTVVRAVAWFTFDYHASAGVMEVLSVAGGSMLVLAALVHLPRRDVLVFSVIVIALHHLLDPLEMPGVYGPGTAPGVAGKLWILVKAGGIFSVFGTSGPELGVGIPLIPLAGVMAAGYASAPIWTVPVDDRRRWFQRCAWALLAGFVLFRAVNVYGDPVPWTLQSGTTATMVSFLNTTRFPPSLLFVLLSLGLASLALASLERWPPVANVLAVIGRVPLLFYLAQVLVTHTIALGVAAAGGRDMSYLFVVRPFTERPPAGTGFALPVAYACWIATLLLYPVCVRAGRARPASRLW